MNKRNNTTWYVLGGLALLCAIGYHVSHSRPVTTNMPPVNDTSPPDTAASTEIILSTGKPS